MRWRNLTNSPGWRLFPADFQQHWRVKTLWKVICIILAVAGLQLALSSAEVALMRSARVQPSWLVGLMAALSALGLLNPLGFFQSASFPGQPTIIPWTLGSWDLPSLYWVAARFLMPAFAADSIAPDRERGKIHELLLAGMKPAEILLAKGVASVLPFFCFALLTAFIQAAVYMASG
jgi:hypothetical protein